MHHFSQSYLLLSVHVWDLHISNPLQTKLSDNSLPSRAMDPLSVTASIITLIGLSDRIITVCRGYVTALKDAPNDLCNILIEVGAIKCTLETLEMRQKLSPIFQSIDVANNPLTGCRRELDALIKLLPVDTEGSLKRKRGSSKISYVELAWPFKQGKVRRILEDLGRHKATLVLVLTTDAG